jgi:hypothetical protein
MLSSTLSIIDEVPGFQRDQLDALRVWCADPRPAVVDRLSGKDDKFADLIEICRQLPDCSPFFHKQLQLNPSTLWRWAMGHSKPPSYVAENVVGDLLDILQERFESVGGRSFGGPNF